MAGLDGAHGGVVLTERILADQEPQREAPGYIPSHGQRLQRLAVLPEVETRDLHCGQHAGLTLGADWGAVLEQGPDNLPGLEITGWGEGSHVVWLRLRESYGIRGSLSGLPCEA